ncbi:MAG: hypothetical protein ACTTJG_04565 [Treponema sp.]
MIKTNGTMVVRNPAVVDALEAPPDVCKKEINGICKILYFELTEKISPSRISY